MIGTRCERHLQPPLRPPARLRACGQLFPSRCAAHRARRWLQALRDAITEGVLTGERAIFYAFAFALPSFRVHHVMTAQATSKLFHDPAGHAAIKLGWDLVDPMCAPHFQPLPVATGALQPPMQELQQRGRICRVYAALQRCAVVNDPVALRQGS